MASAWVAIAPMPATAAGTTEPTARNFEATATPQDSPSSERATIEKVMARHATRERAGVLAGRRGPHWIVPMTRYGDRHASGSADRRRGLPRPQRRHPGASSARASRPTTSSSSASATAGAGPLENLTTAARRRRGPRDPAARRHDPEVVADQPVQGRRRRRADQGEPRRQRRRRADRHRRRGHPRRRHQALRPRRQRRRRAEDHRQRPVRHRLHLRLRHRGQHRDGGHRPAAHHGRVAPPGPRRRGHGPPRGLDRAARRHGRRRQHRADPREAVRHPEGLRATSSTGSRRSTPRSWSSPRAPSRSRAAT